jgi:hypothetical protein
LIFMLGPWRWMSLVNVDVEADDRVVAVVTIEELVGRPRRPPGRA